MSDQSKSQKPKSDEQDGNPLDSTERDNEETAKERQMRDHQVDDSEQFLTTNQGTRVRHTDDSLKAGERGPTLMEDFHFREKMTHFDHESIPERVVHARGSGAHGYFQPYKSMDKYTKASFLQDPNKRTPVFVRFSTVVGSRGSADTVRDVRGFATKFYTDQGVFDLVGNNMPVFFIQDGNKFPDLVHAIKPEPHNEMPQASAAHDTFWDFASLMPEISHMLMWILSDRALPRSFRMMEGFGVHTFRWINADGRSRFVKWHWKPLLGTASLVWDEAQKLAGKDPDWLRRDLWNAIERGHYPEFELGVQIVEEEDEHSFDFDLLDATKIIPEDQVPVTKIGKMVLNRNPDEFFSETEQVAFHPGHVVPGIDFTNDPLLQGRLFSYTDTQINRFNSANFHEVPINRSLAPVHNNQGGGFMRMAVNKGRTNYYPNSLGGGCPMLASEEEGAFSHYREKVDGHKTKERSQSFKDHFTQATMFWNSLAEDEKDRLVSATHFELGKVESKEVRERIVHEIFNHVDHDLAVRSAKGIGIEPPASFAGVPHTKQAPEVSVKHQARHDTIKSRRIAFLVADGFKEDEVEPVRDALKEAEAAIEIVSMYKGTVTGVNGRELEVDKNHVTTGSIMYDAVYIPGGSAVSKQMQQGDVLHFVQEAYKHGKAIGATGDGVQLLLDTNIPDVKLSNANNEDTKGVITADSIDGEGDFIQRFVVAIAAHRHFNRKQKGQIPA